MLILGAYCTTPSKFEQLVVMKAASSRVGTTKIVDNRQVFA